MYILKRAGSERSLTQASRKRAFSNSSGFTLIEILVSLSIVVLMLATGIPAFRRFGNRAELDQAASEVETTILEARNLSLASEVDKLEKFDYYGVVFDIPADPNLARYSIVRTEGPTAAANDENIVKTRSLPPGLEFDSPPTELLYSIENQGQVLVEPENSFIIRSTKLRGGNERIVTINKVTGQVTVSKP